MIKDLLEPFLAAGFGALLGSISAFMLAEKKESHKTTEQRHSALLKTFYALSSQWNIVKGISINILKNQNIDELSKLKNYYSFASAIRVPFDEIAFIVTTDNPNLIQEIHTAEQNFDTSIKCLEMYNILLDDIFHSSRTKIKDLNMETGFVSLETDQIKILRFRNVYRELGISAERTLLKIEEELKNLNEFIKNNYKGMKNLKLVEIDKSEQGDGSNE